MAKATHTESLSDDAHKLALEYLAIHLAIRDRQELVNALCHHHPDLLTSSIRNLVTAYEPIIRALHKAVDLSSGVHDLQSFLGDLIHISKVDSKSNASKSPTVEDYCRLLKKHQGSSHRFIHQVLKNGKELSQWYYEYASHAASRYRQEETHTPDNEGTSIASAGDFTTHVNHLVLTLSEADKALVLPELDAHAVFLSSLAKNSSSNMKTVIHNLSTDKSEMTHGPGIYLSKWQSLMDDTPITPATPKGPVRSGKSDSVRDATRVDTDGAKKGGTVDAFHTGDDTNMPAPDVSNTVRLLIPGFREILATINRAG